MSRELGALLQASRHFPEPEVRRLLAAAKAGCSRSRGVLVMSNLRLVVKIVRGITRDPMFFEDLVMEGLFGLNEAVDRFDMSREGIKFSSYASIWARKRVCQSRYRYGLCPVQIPHHARELALGRKSGSHVSPHALAAARRALLPGARVPLDARLVNRKGDVSEGLGNLIADAAAPGEEAFADRRFVAWLAAVVEAFVAELPKVDRAIFRERLYPPEGEEPATLDQLGARLRLSRERVRQREAAILKRLEIRLRRRGIGPEDMPGARAPRCEIPYETGRGVSVSGVGSWA